MKAVVLTTFGPPDVLQLKEVEKPTPGDHDVLVRIYATTVTAGDCQLRSLSLPLWLGLPIRLYVSHIRRGEMILGQELAGSIEAVGKAVTRFREGDHVFGWTGIRLGAYAEYTCLPDDGVLALKPSTMTYEQAAPLPVGGLEAVYFLRRASIQRGEKVLINGAGGRIGTFAVQLARYFGAEVTAVDSAEKLDMLRALGADHVIDYTHEDFTTRGETYDVIFDVIGKSPFFRSFRLLTRNGRYLLGNPSLSHRVLGRWAATLSQGTNKKVIPWAARTGSAYADDCTFLTELIEAGKIQSVIDGRYQLEQAAEAHRYVEAGHKRAISSSRWTQTPPPNKGDSFQPFSNDGGVSVDADERRLNDLHYLEPVSAVLVQSSSIVG